MPKQESGKVSDLKRTVKRHKMADGTEHIETKETENGTEKHDIDGKIPLTNENCGVISAQLLSFVNNEQQKTNRILKKILVQLIEMNYFLSLLDEDPSELSNHKIKEYFKSKGYELKEIKNG